MIVTTAPVLEKVDGVVMKVGEDQILHNPATGEDEVIDTHRHNPVPYVRIDTAIINSDEWEP